MGLFDLDASELNLADIDAIKGFEVVAPGTYAARLIEVKDFEKDGRKALIFNYEITEDPEHDGKFVGKTVGEFKGYTLPSDPDFDPKGLGYIKGRLVDLGVPADYQGIPAREDLEGLDVIIKVTNNKDRNDPDKVYANVQSAMLDTAGNAAAVKSEPTVNSAPAAVKDTSNPFA